MLDVLYTIRDLVYGGPTPPDLGILAPILLDVCEGMAYLHERNILHGGRQ